MNNITKEQLRMLINVVKSLRDDEEDIDTIVEFIEDSINNIIENA